MVAISVDHRANPEVDYDPAFEFDVPPARDFDMIDVEDHNDWFKITHPLHDKKALITLPPPPPPPPSVPATPVEKKETETSSNAIKRTTLSRKATRVIRTLQDVEAQEIRNSFDGSQHQIQHHQHYWQQYSTSTVSNAVDTTTNTTTNININNTNNDSKLSNDSLCREDGEDEMRDDEDEVVCMKDFSTPEKSRRRLSGQNGRSPAQSRKVARIAVTTNNCFLGNALRVSKQAEEIARYEQMNPRACIRPAASFNFCAAPSSGNSAKRKATANWKMHVDAEPEMNDQNPKVCLANRQHLPQKHSIRTIRRWERDHGRKWYDLSLEEREFVNQELTELYC